MNRFLSIFALTMIGGASVAAAQPANAEQFTESVSDEAPEEDTTSWAASAGGVFNTGNTRSWTLNAGTNFRLVRGRHAIGGEWAFNYGRADLPDDMADAYEETVRNSNARLRYDFFVTENNAIFAAAAHRWDTFAGLDTRLQGQIGYLRNFLKTENHRIWGEIGYDFTYDNLYQAATLQDPETADNPLCADATRNQNADLCHYRYDTIHAARLYVGFDHQPHDNVRFILGAEGLLNFEDIEDLRLNVDAAFRSTITGNLQFEAKLKLLFDNVPVPGRENLDTTTTLSLIYTLI